MGTHVELLDRRDAIALPVAAFAAMSDPALARRVLGGEERPFEVLYGRYKNPLYRYCAAFLRNSEDAEDALQAAMVNAFRALSQGMQGPLAVKPWLYRIAHRECLNILRRRTAHEELTGGEEAPGGGVAERVERSEQIRQLAADLAALAPRARQALLLRELAGLSYAEIGIALEATPTVARNLVYEARQALEELHEGRGLECAQVQRTVSDGDGRALRGRRIGAHLRSCACCRAYREGLARRPKLMVAMVPAVLPAIAARRVLEAATGSLGTAGGGGVLAGGGAAAGAGAVAGAGSSMGAGILGVKGLVVLVSALAGTAAAATPLAVDRIGGGAPSIAVHHGAPLAAVASGLPAGLRVVLADGLPAGLSAPSWIGPAQLPEPRSASPPAQEAAPHANGGVQSGAAVAHGAAAAVPDALSADADPAASVGTARPAGTSVAALGNDTTRAMGVSTQEPAGASAVPKTKQPPARPGTTAATGKASAPGQQGTAAAHGNGNANGKASPPGQQATVSAHENGNATGKASAPGQLGQGQRGAAGAAAAGSSASPASPMPHDGPGGPPVRLDEEPSGSGATASGAESPSPGNQGVSQADPGKGSKVDDAPAGHAAGSSGANGTGAGRPDAAEAGPAAAATPAAPQPSADGAPADATTTADVGHGSSRSNRAATPDPRAGAPGNGSTADHAPPDQGRSAGAGPASSPGATGGGGSQDAADPGAGAPPGQAATHAG